MTYLIYYIIKIPPGIWGVINSIPYTKPSLGLQVMEGGKKESKVAKYLITVWEETSHMLLLLSDFSTAHFLALRLKW